MPSPECSPGFRLHLLGKTVVMSEIMEEPEGFENESEDDEIMAPAREEREGASEESDSE